MWKDTYRFSIEILTTYVPMTFYIPYYDRNQIEIHKVARNKYMTDDDWFQF
jgi:hypothetical protein